MTIITSANLASLLLFVYILNVSTSIRQYHCYYLSL